MTGETRPEMVALVEVATSRERGDAVCEILWELGTTGIEVQEEDSERLRVTAGFPRDADIPAVMDGVEEFLGRFAGGQGAVRDEVRILHVPEFDWDGHLKQTFGITRITDRLVVVPSWISYVPDPHETVIVMDPGMAFGSGAHATTRLCLQELEKELAQHPSPNDLAILDMGCGSGILSIYCARMAAGRIVALDLDPVACKVARENAAINAVADRVEVRQGGIRQADGLFDLIAANLQTQPLLDMAEEIRLRLKPKGRAILSGILEPEAEALVRHFASKALVPLRMRSEEGWVAAVMAVRGNWDAQ